VQALRLAVADLRRDWALSLCQVFALAAVLTPLLVLAGLRHGVLGQLMDELRHAPAMREIAPRVTGTNRFTAAWLDAARARPDVAFAVGDARFTAASVQAVALDAAGQDAGRAPVVVTLVPTGPGDPLRPPDAAWAEAAASVVLSAQAARDLGMAAGQRIALRIPRLRAGSSDGRDLAVTVAAVLPTDRMEDRRAALASEQLVLWVQQFRDGFAVPQLGWPGAPPQAGPPSYERFRLYARDIADVAPLVAWLAAQGIEPVSRIGDIAPVLALDRGLTVVLLIVAGFAAAGLVVAVAATQWNGVQRKRREFALLALIGYGRGFMIRMALLEALLLGVCGVAVALAGFALAARAVDQVFAQLQRLAGPACALGGTDLAASAGLTLALTLLASGFAAWQIGRIEPAETLRDA